MALSSNLNRKVFTASASQTVFAFGDVLYFDQTHLKVYVDGVLKTLSTHYTVSPTTNTPNGTPGGTVTFLSAMVGGEQVIILRDVPLVQSIDYQENGKFPANTHEKGLDWLTMVVQQHNEKLGRSIVLPVTSTKSDIEFPDLIAANAGRAVRIKADMSGLETVDIGTTPYASVLTTKGDLATYASGAQARLPVGANDKILVADSALTEGFGWKAVSEVPLYAALSTKVSRLSEAVQNPIINGCMEVWQRGTTFTGIATPTGVYTADRWKLNLLNTTAVATVNQSTNVPTVAQAGQLFNYSLEVDITTADATLGTGETGYLQQTIEGYNWRHFAQRECVLSFWVMSSKTGEHAVTLTNHNDRHLLMTYSISAADTWEYKSVVISASPSAGAWNYVAGSGLGVLFSLGAGSNLQGTAGDWSTSYRLATSSTVNVLDSTSNFFRITGVKLETGNIATPIQYAPFEYEFDRCLRYYQKSFTYSVAPAQNVGTSTGEHLYPSTVGASVTALIGQTLFQKKMRATPTLTLYNPSAANAQARNITRAQDCSATSTVRVTVDGFSFQATTSASTAAGDAIGVHWTAVTEL